MNINDPNNLLDDDLWLRVSDIPPNDLDNWLVLQYISNHVQLNMAYLSLQHAHIKTVVYDGGLPLETRLAGAARLLVHKDNYETATQILLDAGLRKEANDEMPKNSFIEQLKQNSQWIPLFSSLNADLRVLFLLAFFLILISFLFFVFLINI